MQQFATQTLTLLLLASFPHLASAGGSGLNVLVVVNPNRPDSLELGNHYCARRHVPPQNVVRLRDWTGGSVAWTRAQFQASLLEPLLAQSAALHLGRRVDFVLLSMDIPYQVTEAGSVNSTTAALDGLTDGGA